uniref:NADH-ubiquinone oxidoreductase chain 6 n=1 Tax=Nosodendron sp. BMNH 840466 TaxID=904170 RepID=A0A343A476_9COLE|nr:NADH dehydrogenase subunit 6 [Nosodendron sp. BMNH 840466]
MMMMMNFSVLMSVSILFIKHPLSMGMILLIQTLMISMMTGLLHINFWFSYILFLIMVGGMLIVFLYMTSVASNEKFKFSLKLSITILMMMMIFTLMLFYMDYLFSTMNSNNLAMMNFFLKEKHHYLNKYLNLPSNLIFILLFIYLFISMIAIVKITNIKYGPLRQNI